MRKNILVIFSLIFLLAPLASAVTYETTEQTKLTDVDAYCYGEDAREIMIINFINYNDTYCTGTNISTSNCMREIKIENLDNKKNELTLRAVPALFSLPCAPPSPPPTNFFKVTITPDGDSEKAETYYFNLTECWGWWCASTGTYNQTKCFFDLDLFQGIPVVEDLLCREVVTTNWQIAKQDCPDFTYKMPSTTKWLNVSWGWDSLNNYQIDATDLEFITFSTSRRSKVVDTQYDKLIKITPTHEIFISSIGRLMSMNANFLSIAYSITEVIIIICAVILIPAIAILLIKFTFEKVTGRKLSFGRRR